MVQTSWPPMRLLMKAISLVAMPGPKPKAATMSLANWWDAARAGVGGWVGVAAGQQAAAAGLGDVVQISGHDQTRSALLHCAEGEALDAERLRRPTAAIACVAQVGFRSGCGLGVHAAPDHAHHSGLIEVVPEHGVERGLELGVHTGGIEIRQRQAKL